MFREILDDECGSGVTVDLEGVNNGGVLPFPEGLGADVAVEEELFWAACAAFFASLFKSFAKGWKVSFGQIHALLLLFSNNHNYQLNDELFLAQRQKHPKHRRGRSQNNQ